MSSKKRQIENLNSGPASSFVQQIDELAGTHGLGSVSTLTKKDEIVSYLSKLNSSELEILCRDKPNEAYPGIFNPKEHSTKSARINLITPWILAEFKNKKSKPNLPTSSISKKLTFPSQKQEKIQILSDLLSENERLETGSESSSIDMNDDDDEVQELKNLDSQIEFAQKRKQELLRTKDKRRANQDTGKTGIDIFPVTTMHVTFYPHMNETEVATNLRLLIKKLSSMVQSGQQIPWSWCVPFIQKSGEDLLTMSKVAKNTESNSLFNQTSQHVNTWALFLFAICVYREHCLVLRPELTEPLHKLLNYCYKVKDHLPSDEALVEQFIPYINSVIAKQLGLFRASMSYVPDFVTIDMPMLGAEFFTLGSILLRAKNSTSFNLAKKTRVMNTGSFFTRKVSLSETSSDPDDSDDDVQFVKIASKPSLMSAPAKTKLVSQQKQIFCYDYQRVGGCQTEDCQYCKQSKKTCIACLKKGHGASACTDDKAQANYFLQRIKPSAKLSHGDHPLYGGDARILLGKGFARKQPAEQTAILKDAVKHCQDHSKKIANGSAQPERDVVYTVRQ
jgi:hypothetical protein